MLSSTISGSAEIVRAVVVVEAVAGVAFEAQRAACAPRRRAAGRIRDRLGSVSPCATASHQAPVCSSTTGAFSDAAAASASAEGSMNSETRMPARLKLGNERLQVVVAADDVEPALGRALGALFRHQAAGVRLDAQGDVEHLVGRRHLEIERLGDRRLQPLHVVVADVAAILAQMRGDAVGAGLDRQQRGAHGIGNRAAARVAHGRDMVDVDAQPQRGHRVLSLSQRPSAAARLPGLTGGQRGQLRRQGVGGIGGNVERRERDARNADLGLAAGAVDQAGGADDLAGMLGRAPRGTRATTAPS